MQCGKIVISGETGVGQVLVWKIFVLWFLCLLALQSSAWAQRHGRHAGYRPGHFGARQPSFQGRAPGFHGNHPGYGRPGLVYRFPSHRPYRFSPSYGAFRHYRPYPQYHRRYFYVGPRVYPFVPFRYGIPPYPYHSGFADPYWPGIGYSSRYLLGEERARVTGPERETERGPTERMWLLALNDGSIRAATDYWLDDGTLRYLTRDGKSASVRSPSWISLSHYNSTASVASTSVFQNRWRSKVSIADDAEQDADEGLTCTRSFVNVRLVLSIAHACR